MAKNIPIGQILLNNGDITESQLQRALEFQKITQDKRLGTILVELGYVTERSMLKAMSERMDAPFIDILGYRINPKAAALLPREVAEKYNVLPVDFKNEALVVAANDALDFYVFDEIKMITNMEVTIALAGREDISSCIQKAYSSTVIDQVTYRVNQVFGESGEAEEYSRESERIEGTPVVQMVNMLIQQAHGKGASDIHVEPSERNLTIRYRVNGDLIIHTTLKMTVHNPIITRLKIMGGMNIAEKRLPQDGKCRFKKSGLNIDLRISTMPTVFGEKLVLRLLSSGHQDRLLDIQNLGMTGSQTEMFERMLKTPNGIILVTGPTGSGKTTTLYAALSHLVKRKINIITVEDPVEKVIEGISQVQVNAKAELTFAKALRSLLRQDPDVIMIGEMRDSETATIGVRAAITGHQVLATIHTNDCASSVTRLIDMGVPAYMAAASLSGIVAQRLVKRLCPHCKETYRPDGVERALFEHGCPEFLYRPVGCERCNYTGYADRTAIYEMIWVDSEFGEMIAKGAGVHALRAHGRQKGNRFLKDRVIELAVAGDTSVAEVEKIVYSIEQ